MGKKKNVLNIEAPNYTSQEELKLAKEEEENDQVQSNDSSSIFSFLVESMRGWTCKCRTLNYVWAPRCKMCGLLKTEQ